MRGCAILGSNPALGYCLTVHVPALAPEGLFSGPYMYHHYCMYGLFFSFLF